MGLHVVDLAGDPEVDIAASVKRNIPLVISGIAAAMTPRLCAATLGSPTSGYQSFVGLLAVFLVGLVALIPVTVEGLFVLCNNKGRRVGDWFARTQVVETKRVARS